MVSDGGEPPSSRYRIVQRIASGGMGSVYLATQHGAAGFRRVVAVKRAFPQLLEDPKFRALMASEVRLAALVRHPNVVAISDVEESDGELSLVMEYIEGASLAELLKFTERMPAAIGMRVVLDAAAGLAAVHECTDEEGAPLALVHRDVSPQNILVGVDGVARIADFGIAQVHQPSSDSTVSGLLRGKPGYMAPEYVESGVATPACDVFALAIIAWEVLTRQRLFRYGTDIETIDRVRAAVVVPPSLLASEVSPALDAVLLQALSRRPEVRYPSAGAFGEALERALRESGRLASHSAVGAFVRRAAEATLSERRSRVLDAIHHAAATSTIGAPRSQAASAPEIPVVLGPGTSSTRIDHPRAANQPARHIVSSLAFVLATAIVATAAVELGARAPAAAPTASRPAEVAATPTPIEITPVVMADRISSPVPRVAPRTVRTTTSEPPVVRLAIAIDASTAAPSPRAPEKAPENPYGRE